MSWKTGVRKALLDFDAPRVLKAADLRLLAVKAGMDDASPSTPVLVSRLARSLTDEGVLQRFGRGLYLNCCASPRPAAAEVAQHIRAGSVVSLQTVLGDSGVLNNWTPWTTSVSPREAGQGGMAEVEYDGTKFKFSTMSRAVLETGDIDDRLDLSPYPRATPEAALMHWIYLSQARHHSMGAPTHELDLEHLNLPRLFRLADDLGLRAEADDIVARAQLLADDEASQTNGASTMGF